MKNGNLHKEKEKEPIACCISKVTVSTAQAGSSLKCNESAWMDLPSFTPSLFSCHKPSQMESFFPSSPGHLGETGFPPWLPPIWFLGSALPALTGLAGWKMNAGFMRRSPSPRTEQTKPDPDNKTLFNPPGEKRRKRKEDRALRKSGEDEHRYEKH